MGVASLLELLRPSDASAIKVEEREAKGVGDLLIFEVHCGSTWTWPFVGLCVSIVGVASITVVPMLRAESSSSDLNAELSSILSSFFGDEANLGLELATLMPLEDSERVVSSDRRECISLKGSLVRRDWLPLVLVSTPIGLGEVAKFEVDLMGSLAFLASILAGNGEVAKLEVDLAASSPRSPRTARNAPVPAPIPVARPVVMLLLLNGTGL